MATRIVGIAPGFGRTPVRPSDGRPVPRCEFCSLLVDIDQPDAECFRSPDHVHHCAELAIVRAERREGER